MLDEAVINKLPSTLVTELTATIQQNQAIHRPELPYCAWRVVSDVQIGLSGRGEKASSNPNETITEIIETVQEAVLEFNFYSDSSQNGATKEARQLCQDFLNKLDLTTAMETLKAAGIGLLEKRGYGNIDTHLGDDWERRALCELRVNYVESNEDDIPFIEQLPAGAKVQGTYVNVDGTELT
jgi:hypothetical protein